MLSKHSIQKKGHVTTGKRIGKKLVAVKAHQVERYHHHKQIVTDVMTPAPNELALNNGAQIKYFLKSDALKTIESATLRFQVRMDTATDELVPVPYWFDRIEFYNRHSGEELGRLYGDALFLFLNALDQQHVEQWSELANYNAINFSRSQNPQTLGTTRYYYLPLVASIFEGMHLDMTTINTDIEIRLHPASGGPTINGVGTPVLIEVAGVYEVDNVDDASHHAHKDFLSKHVPIHYYLDVQQYVETGRIMNAGTQYEFDLDQFNHVSAAIVAVIRRTGETNSNNGLQDYIDLYDGTVDITNSTGKSMYGGGRDVPADYLRNVIAPKYVDSQFFGKVAMYPIMFGDLQKALAGSADGTHRFNGDKQSLVINTPSQLSNPANLVIAQSAVADGGSVTILYKYSQITVAYNATPSQIIEAVDAMPSIVEDGLKANVAQDFANALDVVIYLLRTSDQTIRLRTPLSVISNLTNAGAPVALSSVWTEGVNGWLGGIAYDVTIYSLYFRSVHQDNRKLDSQELV